MEEKRERKTADSKRMTSKGDKIEITTKIRDLRVFNDCIRAENELIHIIQRLEMFSDWYSQFYFNNDDYKNSINEAVTLLETFKKRFVELAEGQLIYSREEILDPIKEFVNTKLSTRDKSAFYAWIKTKYGVKSLKELSIEQGIEVLHYIERLIEIGNNPACVVL